MRRLVKEFTDGSFLEYDRGKIDDWYALAWNKCVVPRKGVLENAENS